MESSVAAGIAITNRRYRALIGKVLALDLHRDLVNSGTSTDIECFVVTVAKPETPEPLRHSDGSQVLPFRRNNPHAARTRRIEIALRVHPHAVGPAWNTGSGIPLLCGGHVKKHSTVRDRIVGLHVICPDDGIR